MPVLNFTDPNPKMVEAQLAFLKAVNNEGVLSRRVQELVRLRIAFHNQCRTCMAVRYDDAGVTEDLVCSLEKPYEAPDLTDADRAALRFADLFATNHLAIDEEVVAELHRHFSDREIHELGMSCAANVAGGRLTAISLELEGLPDYYKADPTERLAPWGTQETVAVSR